MTAVVKVENISPQLPEASLRQLFGFIGAVRKLQWISSGVVENAFAPGPRECLIQFGDIKEANASLFLDGTEFADRKIKIYMSDKKLNEETSASSQPVFGGSQSVLPLPLVQPAAINPLLTPVLNPVLAPVLNPALVPNVVRPVLPLPTATFASPFAYQTATIAAAAAVANAANSYQIPGAVMDASRIEEIARTVYVGNIAPGLTESDLLGVFSKCGPVSFIKLAAGDPSQNTRFAFIEFTDMPAAQAAMLLNGTSVGGRAIKVNHSKNTIVKPPKPAASQRQVDEILKRVREAQAKITSKYSGEGEVSSPAAEIATSSASPRPAEGKEESRRRSRSRSSSRDRHRHRSRRSRSRSRDRDRKRRSPSPRARSRSRDRDRDRRRSRSRDRHRRR